MKRVVVPVVVLLVISMTSCHGAFKKDLNKVCNSSTYLSFEDMTPEKEFKVMDKYLTYTLRRTGEGRKLLIEMNKNKHSRDRFDPFEKVIEEYEVKTCLVLSSVTVEGEVVPAKHMPPTPKTKPSEGMVTIKKEEIVGRIAGQGAAIKKCFDTVLYAMGKNKTADIKAKAHGHIVVSFVVEKDGVVKFIDTKLKDSELDGSIIACVLISMHSTRFSSSDVKTRVSYPYRFSAK